ncbi:hypothetical protein L3Y34_002623 [Caenorhabditis briggsae]|uniref:Uncharacterized protein n=2 Tax=Caenorhabditis briggsae TaxID=6238 RepID=A0AAE9ISS9_CAEBR|nr:hypothetical protein L3Y34_002623 [Caenorhabditis briggsae]
MILWNVLFHLAWLGLASADWASTQQACSNGNDMYQDKVLKIRNPDGNVTVWDVNETIELEQESGVLLISVAPNTTLELKYVDTEALSVVVGDGDWRYPYGKAIRVFYETRNFCDEEHTRGVRYIHFQEMNSLRDTSDELVLRYEHVCGPLTQRIPSLAITWKKDGNCPGPLSETNVVERDLISGSYYLSRNIQVTENSIREGLQGSVAVMMTAKGMGNLTSSTHSASISNMTTALAKKKTASSKAPKSPKSPKSTKSAKTVTTKTKSKSRMRQPRKAKKSKKSKKGFFSCCAKKRKVKRSSKKSGGKKLARSPAPKKPAGAGKAGKSSKSAKKSSKEKPTPPPPEASLQKVQQQKKPDASAKLLPQAKPAPLRSMSSEPIPPPPPQAAPLAPALPLLPPPSSTTPTTPTTSGVTDPMVTAPTSQPPSSEMPTQPSPPVIAHPSQEVRKPSKEESGPDDEDLADRRKHIAYPASKFFMTQFVKDECRVRRWIYEESTPLSMESNVKYMLKQASQKLEQCQTDKDRRGDMLKDLNELSRILDDGN